MKWYTVFELKENGLKFCYENEDNPVMSNFINWCDRNNKLDTWNSWTVISDEDLKKTTDVIFVPKM